MIRQGLVSYPFRSFFLLATLPRLISSSCLDRFQLNLVTRTPDPWHLCHMIRVGSRSRRGHRGQKGNFTKTLLLQITGYGHVTHVHASAWPPLQKLSLYKIIQGHLGSLGSKGHFHQKCYFSYRLHGMVTRLMHMHQLETLYKNYRFKNSPGVIWGLWGQKVVFTKNAITLPCYIAWP